MSDTAAEFVEPAQAASPAAMDTWDQLLATMRSRYPGQTDGVLFCILKLQQNPEASLRDFRDEAALHGLTLAGRALHSAKVMLGLAEKSPSPKRKRAEAPVEVEEAQPVVRRSSAPANSLANIGGGIENKLMAAVSQLQNAAAEENARLRAVLGSVLDIVSEALSTEDWDG